MYDRGQFDLLKEERSVLTFIRLRKIDIKIAHDQEEA